MTIVVILCDRCGCDLAQALPEHRESYTVNGGPVMDICYPCAKKPFKDVPPHPRGVAIREVIRLALGGAQ
jgi:hypothetical protein